MSRCPSPHVALGEAPPVTTRGGKCVEFEVSLAAIDGAVRLDMRQRGGEDQEFISIEHDCEVTIILKGDQLFFSKDYHPITMKDDFQAFYGGLDYGDYDKDKERFRSATFRARYNEGGERGTNHPFNINVDLYQRGGKPTWIPISIDPDIKNPPPWPQ